MKVVVFEQSIRSCCFFFFSSPNCLYRCVIIGLTYNNKINPPHESCHLRIIYKVVLFFLVHQIAFLKCTELFIIYFFERYAEIESSISYLKKKDSFSKSPISIAYQMKELISVTQSVFLRKLIQSTIKCKIFGTKLIFIN